MDSPTRRVLGDKNPNTLLHIQSTKASIAGTQQPLPNTRQLSASKRPLSPDTSSPFHSPRAGLKRKIAQVQDEEEELASQEQRNDSSLLSQMTDVLSDPRSEIHDETAQTSVDPTSKSTYNASFASSLVSREDHLHIDTEFEIRDEPSQRALDAMHAVTFTETNSQLVPPLRPNLVSEASQASVSMSSLIDFENNRSSQNDDLQLIDETENLADLRPRTEQNTRKELMLEKAETLRTRLQLALYKVQTNQISKPFARLQVPRPRSPSLEFQMPPSSSPKTGSSTVKTSSEHHSTQLEARVAAARARATMAHNPPVKSLSSLPVPQILPTTFSARWANEEAEDEAVQGHQLPAVIPSSPPLSRGGEDEEDEDVSGSETTPNRQLVEPPRTPVQLSSPVSSRRGDDDEEDDDDDEPTLVLQRQGYYRRAYPGGLTSSVVKGEAANSLLELVRGAGVGGGHGRTGSPGKVM